MKKKSISFNLTVKQKKQLTIGMCVFVVLFLMGVALYCENANEAEQRGQEGVVANASEKENNSVALNLNSTYEKSQEASPVSSDSEGNRVVQNPSAEQEEQKNVVVTNPTAAPVKLASSVLEDHGVAVEDTENLAVLYQYPIGIGSDEEQNFDGKQKQQDVIRKMTVETQWEETQPENDTASGAAVSGSTVLAVGNSSVSGAGLGVATEGAVVAETEQGDDTESIRPVVSVLEDSMHIISAENERIYCTNQNQVSVHLTDGGTPINKFAYAYGEKIYYITELKPELPLQLLENFFGRVLLYCVDENGVSSEPVEEEFLVDTSAPKICFSNSKVCTAPYCMQVDVVDAGHIVSGIDKITCRINGEPYEITDLVAKECVRLNNAVKVSSKVGFSLFLDEVGTYDISVEVTDNAGNVTSESTKVEVSKPELVAVYMPRNFKIHIDPQQLLEKEQIFSDDIILKNVSGFDVKVNVSEINVVIQDEVSEEGIRRDCNLYLINPDNGQKIRLNKGENKDVISYRLPADESGDTANLKFVGDTSDGSDAMWKDSDIRIDVKLTFEKW